MKIPKSFKIKGQQWEVLYKWRLTHEGEHIDGLCDPEARTIWLDRMVPKEKKFSVFLHELIHAIISESHLNEAGGIDGFHEEVIAQAIPTVFEDLFIFRWKRQK